MQPLTYAKDTQIHLPTKQTPFDNVLSRYPLGPILLRFNDAIAPEVHSATAPEVLHARLKVYTCIWRAKVDAHPR